MASRRNVLKSMLMGAGLVSTNNLPNFQLDSGVARNTKYPLLKGNINHSACYWVYQKDFTVDQFCQEAKKIGLKAVDLLGKNDWATLKKYGLNCGMANGAEISLYEGFNHREHHPKLIENYTELIPVLASYGFNNIICFSGARKGIDDETGLTVCAEGLKRLMPLAEKHKVTVTMELLNSKIELLYDIYHMQIMEGDLIRTLTENAAYISHYHTGGVPGRHEIDESQEIYYPAIMRAIIKTGYKGSVAQEFIPSKKPAIDRLVECVKICDV